MIISDLCDEYAVLVSQNKAPVYGYDNIEQYYQDTEIRRPRYDKTGFLPILRLLGQTIRKQRKDENAPVKKQKKKSAIENVSSEMVSAIMQAILNGTPYPVTLINVVERRIDVERDVPPDKAAIIKAYYLRKTTNEQFKEVLQMDINEESEYLPYVLGRIFFLVYKKHGILIMGNACKIAFSNVALLLRSISRLSMIC